MVALDSLEAARSAFAEWKADTLSFSRAHLFPRDRIRVELQLVEGNPETALEILLEMDRRGMPHGAGLWNIEWREALGRAYLMSGRLDKAAAVHEKMLREFRGHFISHYELGKIYEEMGRAADAKRQYELFLDAWAEADEGLPQLEDARARLSRL